MCLKSNLPIGDRFDLDLRGLMAPDMVISIQTLIMRIGEFATTTSSSVLGAEFCDKASSELLGSNIGYSFGGMILGLLQHA